MQTDYESRKSMIVRPTAGGSARCYPLVSLDPSTTSYELPNFQDDMQILNLDYVVYIRGTIIRKVDLTGT